MALKSQIGPVHFSWNESTLNLVRGNSFLVGFFIHNGWVYRAATNPKPNLGFSYIQCLQIVQRESILWCDFLVDSDNFLACKVIVLDTHTNQAWLGVNEDLLSSNLKI